MVDVLYSLVDVNRQLDRLALDFLYIRHLDITTNMTIKSLYNQTFSIDTQVLSRICEKILPRIHHQVQKLTVEQYSMKQVLVAASYPQLYSLSLLNFQEKILYQYLTGDSILRDLLTKQITHLGINIKTKIDDDCRTVSKIFPLILSLCENLIDLNFGDMFPTQKYSIPVYLPSTNNMSSTLIKLKINLITLADCLDLLDGRLDCLSTLIVNVSYTYYLFRHIDRTKHASKLKCFSFTTSDLTYDYDTLIVPLLCRMINLEELKLYLSVIRFDSTYIDGVQLYEQVLIYMTQLNKFTFSIDTTVDEENARLELASNEDIQRSFIGRGYHQVASYVHTNSMKTEGKCHIYSLPYEFEYFLNLNNYFQGDIFHKVRYLKMDDTDPFEHKLFQLISQDFPFLEFLYILNNRPIKDKQHLYTLIIFPYLAFLDLECAHADYAELFLLEKNTHLPRLLNLCIKYKKLAKITNHFTIDPTHFNFGTLESLPVCHPFVRPKNFHQYFPLL